MNDTTTKTAYEVIHDPVTGTFGFVCRVHGIHRAGMKYQTSAESVLTDHVRTSHTPHAQVFVDNLTLDLTAMAIRVGAAYLVQEAHQLGGGQHSTLPILDAWEAMTGLDPETAQEVALHIVGHHDHLTAAVVPL